MRGTREVWSRRVERWKRSGLTSTAFAAREGLVPSTLRLWKSKLVHESVAAGTALAVVPEQPVQFVEISGPAFAGGDGRFEVELASCRVRFAPSFDGDALRRLLDVLEARR